MPPILLNQPSVPGEAARKWLSAARQHSQQNRWLEAAKCYLEATRHEPDCIEAFCQLALILDRLGQLEEARICAEKALRLNPDAPRLNLFHGSLLKKLGRFEQAAASCRREIQIEPGNPDAFYNLGLVLQNLDRPGEAISAYRKALELKPGYGDALVNLGSVLRQTGDAEAALLCFSEAVRSVPRNPEAHWELCATLLALGRFEQGWKEYEWRWKQKDFSTPTAPFEQPRWNGSDLRGRRILLHAEQGYGDVIQFVRYATMVARRGGEVIVGCPAALRGLVETVPGVREVATHRGALGSFEVHAPLMSLPGIFGTALGTIPAEVPYFTVAQNDFPPGTAADKRPKVGIVWAGDPAHKNDRNRSIPFDALGPLLKMPCVRWHSLQAGVRAEDLTRLPAGSDVADLGRRFRNFSDTAQAIAQLDLVISVDTAVAHLAGALGKRVWTLLPFEAEWRWMIGRQDTPWYPTMRLFRQTQPANWKELLERVAGELAAGA